MELIIFNYQKLNIIQKQMKVNKMATISKSGTRVFIEDFNLIKEEDERVLVECVEFDRASGNSTTPVWIRWENIAIFGKPSGKRQLVVDYSEYRNIIFKLKEGK